MKVIKIALLLLVAFSLNAQNKSINGNGRITTSLKAIDAFDALYINMLCDIYVQVGSMPMISITADKNVINKISAEVKNGELQIKVMNGFWIESSRPSIYMQTPFLNKLTTKGEQTNIGVVKIEGINVEQFDADLFYGEVYLEGTANTFILHSSNRSYYAHKSELDASRLLVKELDALLQGSNTAKVSVSDILMADLKHDAVLTYDPEPKVIKLKGDSYLVGKGLISTKIDQELTNSHEQSIPEVQLVYVDLKVKNNSVTRKNFIIKGPKSNGKEFSYGFPMMPFSTRAKKVPAGTKIFLQKDGINGKELITITADNTGQTVDLFRN